MWPPLHPMTSWTKLTKHKKVQETTFYLFQNFLYLPTFKYFIVCDIFVMMKITKGDWIIFECCELNRLNFYDFICILFVPWLKYLNLCYLANIMTLFQIKLNWITLFKVYLSNSSCFMNEILYIIVMNTYIQRRIFIQSVVVE